MPISNGISNGIRFLRNDDVRQRNGENLGERIRMRNGTRVLNSPECLYVSKTGFPFRWHSSVPTERENVRLVEPRPVLFLLFSPELYLYSFAKSFPPPLLCISSLSSSSSSPIPYSPFLSFLRSPTFSFFSLSDKIIFGWFTFH